MLAGTVSLVPQLRQLMLPGASTEPSMEPSIYFASIACPTPVLSCRSAQSNRLPPRCPSEVTPVLRRGGKEPRTTVPAVLQLSLLADCAWAKPCLLVRPQRWQRH